MGLTGGLAAMSLVSGGLQLAGSISSASAQRQQGEYQRAANEQNAQFADAQAADAITRGDATAGRYYRTVKSVIGTQKVAYGGQGVDVNSGSAVQVRADSAAAGEADMATIVSNAHREAWGFSTEADNYRTAGDLAYKAATTNANNTILSGGMNFLNSSIGAAKYGYDAFPKTKPSGSY